MKITLTKFKYGIKLKQKLNDLLINFILAMRKEKNIEIIIIY